MTELGNRLKEARLAKGMSLDDLQTATKIQKRYLVGIEEGNYSVMPGKFYVRAFIKQYAEVVGLHPEELFEEFKSDIPTAMNEDIPEKLSRVQTRKDISGGTSKFFEILPKVLIAVFVVGVFAVVYYFYEQFSGNNATDPAEPENTPSVNVENNLPEDTDENNGSDENEAEDGTGEDAEQEEPVEEPVEEPEPPAQEVTVAETNGQYTTYELKNTDKFELKLVSTGETWVNIKNGKDYSFFQGMLVAGDEANSTKTVDLTKEEAAVLVIGNSSNTEIYINDEKIEYAVSPSDFVRQDITIRNSADTE